MMDWDLTEPSKQTIHNLRRFWLEDFSQQQRSKLEQQQQQQTVHKSDFATFQNL